MAKRAFSHTVVHPNSLGDEEELAVLFAGHSQTEPAHRMGPQVLDYYLVHTVIEGTGTYRCRNKLYELHATDSFFIFPGELHAYQSDRDNPWRYRWIAFRGSKARLWLHKAGIDADRPVVRSGGDVAPLQAARAIMRRFRSGDWTSDWEAEGWLQLAFASWARSNQPDGSPSANKSSIAAKEANRAARWLEAQMAQPISIAAMAQAFGYHRAHLTKLFRNEMGMSPIRYLQHIRIERAKLLLREPLTIEEVAASVGYADPLYFSKAFKKWTSRTPTDYRNSVRR